MKIANLLLLFSVVSANEKIVMMGSDTLGAKMVPQLKEAYLKAGNEVDIEITAEGSSQAFTNLFAGTANIGMSSRDVKEDEKKKFTDKGQALIEHIAGWDMIAVVVNEKSKVKSLTLKQVEGIFTGDITDWGEVGGEPGKISVYTRNTASGTYKTFQKLAMSKRPYGKNTKKMAGGERIDNEVASNEKGIGYVGLAYAGKEGLRAVKIEGVSPKPKNKATYALSRKLYYYTVGEPKGEVKRFLEWAMKSPESKEIVSKVGFIPN